MYLYIDDQQRGPYEAEQLRAMWNAGTFTPQTMAWQEGLSEWAPFDQIINVSGNCFTQRVPLQKQTCPLCGEKIKADGVKCQCFDKMNGADPLECGVELCRTAKMDQGGAESSFTRSRKTIDAFDQQTDQCSFFNKLEQSLSESVLNLFAWFMALQIAIEKGSDIDESELCINFLIYANDFAATWSTECAVAVREKTLRQDIRSATKKSLANELRSQAFDRLDALYVETIDALSRCNMNLAAALENLRNTDVAGATLEGILAGGVVGSIVKHPIIGTILGAGIAATREKDRENFLNNQAILSIESAHAIAEAKLREWMNIVSDVPDALIDCVGVMCFGVDADLAIQQHCRQAVTKIVKLYAFQAIKLCDSIGRLKMGQKNGLSCNNSERADVRWYRIAAENGNAAAQTRMGLCLHESKGVEKNEREAVQWYRKAAEQGHAKSQVYLGLCLQHGSGVEKNEREAVQWYRKAAEQGDAIGQNNLGDCLQDGTGVEKNEQEAVHWFRKAAEQGDAIGQNNLGVCLQHGSGVEKNEQEAVHWFRKAAEQGDAEVQSNLGVCLLNGIGVEKNEQEAAHWFRKASEQGHAKAQNNIGVFLLNGIGVEKNEQEAAHWFRKASEQGDATGQIKLGICLLNGIGVEKNEQEAVRWFRKAAEQGLAMSELYLGLCLQYGNGVERDEREAVKWFSKAAEQGLADGEFNFGVCLNHGAGVEKNEREAVQWYRKAAEQGHAKSQVYLGLCLQHGSGVEKNEREAVQWYRKAAELSAVSQNQPVMVGIR